ncbi:BCCT family transporter, partial [Klebsiella pneumoniae]|uniref:BCCT family transporter n=1 Tax=Klebsiella pneumoniae TaxID=573 RepID=UPI00292BC567
WGLHAWAIYAIVALILAFFSYRHGLPLTLRSALYPIIGDRIYGPVGHAVDIFAVIGEHEKPRGSHRMMPSTGVKITTIIS